MARGYTSIYTTLETSIRRYDMSDAKLELVINVVEEIEYEEVDDYEQDDEPYEDEYEDHEAVVAYETWNLENDVNLASEAASWYLLMDLWLDGKDEGKFLKRTGRLAEIFSAYADMVIGGELRYTRGHVLNPDESLDESFIAHLRRNMDGMDRSTAWESWADFRMTKGTPALHMAEEAFNEFGDGNSYGGSKWAYIAHTLLMFESGEITPITFVDMCWGLEHNGGQFFGKLWSTYKLQYVLDANVNEKMDDLLPVADVLTRKFYEEVTS